MIIQEEVSLKAYNTFGIDSLARYFSAFSSVDELTDANRQLPNANFLILGGGSNILLTKNFDGLVLKNEISGIELVHEDENFVIVKSGAGEIWHELVMYCVDKEFAGMENLSLIPGNVGASPMQNIGAYGVEVKDVFHELEAWDLQEKCIQKFSKEDCEFGYRESVFKRKFKNRFIISSVSFKLNKKPVFNTSYGAINQELERMGVKELSIRSISDAVINIRQSKLPDPKQVGNAGSFFKNPQIPNEDFEKLKTSFPDIVAFPAGKDFTKLAAGWMIEQCGWKGYRKGDAGCYPKQALVLVNYGNAKGNEIYNLSEEIIESVFEKFGVRLEREVNVI